MELRRLGSDEGERWEQALERAPHATVFHQWDWLQQAAQHTKAQLHLLEGMEGQEVVAVCPLFVLRKGPFRFVFSPPPATGMFTLGPLLLGASQLKGHKLERRYQEFVQALDAYIRRLRPQYVGITTSPGLIDVRPFLWAGYQATPRYTYKIDLSQGVETVWESFHKKLRSDIKRTGEEIEVSVGGAGDLFFLHQSVKGRYEEQGRRLGPGLAYLKDLYASLGEEHLRLFLARRNGQPVGAVMCVMHRDTIGVWLGVAKANISGLPVNDLVQWECIQWAARQGYRYFELMGANTQRLCDFKSKYSPELVPYFAISRATLMGRLAEAVYRRLKG